jgi:hypothetical protein
MDDRIPGYGAGHRYYGPHDQEQLAGPRPGRGQDYSSARDYAAAGEYGDDWRRDSRPRSGGYRPQRYRDDYARADLDRGFFERAGDEVRSWFGDDDAERRRQRDMREDAARQYDPHYGAWRRERIAELDRDYDEYRRENAERFHNEFSGWRTERQSQREGLGRVTEHMEVVGSDGEHLGTVDKVRGDRIILTKSDPDAGGHHHSIPSRWIQSVEDKVTLRKRAADARAAWKNEERGAFFGEEGDGSRGPHYLNRAFSGTY